MIGNPARWASLPLLVSITVACGVPTDGEPREINAQDVPFALLGPTPAETATTLPEDTDTSRVIVYFVSAEGFLTRTPRSVPSPATTEKTLRALLAGVTETEASELSSAITSDTRLRAVEGPHDGLVTIDLSSDLLDVTGNQQILALAQVVFTATALPTVDRVLFEFDGEQREVPTGEGKLTAVPLSRNDYRQLYRDE